MSEPLAVSRAREKPSSARGRRENGEAKGACPVKRTKEGKRGHYLNGRQSCKCGNRSTVRHGNGYDVLGHDSRRENRGTEQSVCVGRSCAANGVSRTPLVPQRERRNALGFAYWAAVAVLLGPPPRWVDSLATVWMLTVLGWSCGYLLLDCAGDVYVSGSEGCARKASARPSRA